MEDIRNGKHQKQHANKNQHTRSIRGCGVKHRSAEAEKAAEFVRKERSEGRRATIKQVCLANEMSAGKFK